MKKYLALLIVCLMAVALTGCGDSGNKDQFYAGNTVAGGWQLADSPVITDEVAELLAKATEELDGVYYIPVAYIASQVVAGKNHAILCRVGPVVPDPEERYEIVYLYEDLQGNAEITNEEIYEGETGISEEPGAWTQSETPVISEEEMAVFEEAVAKVEGATYDPIAIVSTQVVEGKNYCFLCEETLEGPGSVKEYVLVYINENTEGVAGVTQIVHTTTP